MEHIVGEEKLDMVPEMEDQTCPLLGKIPLPPVMIQQLDMILTIGVLQPLQKQVLEDFQKLVLANNPRNWMTVYLVTFMSLHSCAKISEENYNNARKHGLNVSNFTCRCILSMSISVNSFLLAEVLNSEFHSGTSPLRQRFLIILSLSHGIGQPIRSGLAQTTHDAVLSHVS